jgi:microcystin-dependent protein
MEPFLGQLLLASFNFAPRGFAMANGQLLSIQQNTALFALLGTFFGGNGVNNFALPNLQGRVPVHQGNYQGTSYTMGQIGGEESHTITAGETPQHNHQVKANKTAATTEPALAFLGGAGAAAFNSLANTANMNQSLIANAGGSLPHENRQPYLVMTWVIALSGIFPSRS